MLDYHPFSEAVFDDPYPFYRRLRDEAHDIAACAPGETVEVLGRGVVRRPEAYARPAG